MTRDEQGRNIIPMTPSFLVSLIVLLLGGGGVAGVKIAQPESHINITSQSDHDSIILLSSQVGALKDNVAQLRADVQEQSVLMRRVLYGRGDVR